jgi:hypothetical protein
VNVRRFCIAVAALLVGAVIAGCSSPSVPATHRRSGTTATTTHWWSGTSYCGILRQTIRAGHSVLAGTNAGDPALLTATKSFVADLTAAAPDPVRSHWLVLGPALTELVGSGDKPAAISGVDSRQVSAAAASIAADAKVRCHVDLSA